MNMAEVPTSSETGAQLHPDLENVATKRSIHNAPPEELLAGEADAELLGESQVFRAVKVDS